MYQDGEGGGGGRARGGRDINEIGRAMRGWGRSAVRTRAEIEGAKEVVVEVCAPVCPMCVESACV